MRGPLLALVLLVPALAGCAAPPPPQPPTTAVQPPTSLAVESVASGLEVPWGIAFAPDGRIFVTERPGRVRVIADGALQPNPVKTFQVGGGEGGLMGIQLDPDFARNQLVYVMYTAGAAGGGLTNRVVRFPADRPDQVQVLLDGIQAGSVHDGGRIKFGPDGKLYVTTGEAGNPALAQMDTSLNGKVLRIDADGTVPADNPLPGSPVWSKGHRNPQGLAWMPDGTLVETEHGPSGGDGPGGYDEVNLIVRGANYGWPQKYCSTSRTALALRGGGDREPVACYTPAIAPAGLAYAGSDRYPDWKGSLFFGALRGSHLHRIVLEQGKVTVDEKLLDQRYGRLREVVEGPDGWLYFTTSNRDGRGSPRDGDDHVYRLAMR